MTTHYFKKGWVKFDRDPELERWLKAVSSTALATADDPSFKDWHRYGNTWFAGVNALPNDESGRLEDSPPLKGEAVDFIRKQLKIDPIRWDPAQVSIIYLGYPKPMAGESAATFRYRLNRDAAHVDGLRRIGAERRRFLLEHHQFILGLPLTTVTDETAPLVVWEGSHEIMRQAFLRAYQDLAPEDWEKLDVTDIYHAARRQAFETCPRRAITAAPGEAYLVHRLALHGMAPWQDDRDATPSRAILYFRPDGGDPQAWLDAP